VCTVIAVTVANASMSRNTVAAVIFRLRESNDTQSQRCEADEGSKTTSRISIEVCKHSRIHLVCAMRTTDDRGDC
jgi:hypothetical protein